METEHYEEMLSNLRTIAMNRLFQLMDEAEEASFEGDVGRVQEITKEALFQVDIVSDALFSIICDNYGADKATLDRRNNDELRLKVKTQFVDRIMLAIHIRNCIKNGIPES